MSLEQEYISASRFGYGIRPNETPYSGGFLAQLQTIDPADTALDAMPLTARAELLKNFRQERRANGNETRKFRQLRQQMRDVRSDDFRRFLLRPMLSPRGFRERVFAFWIDHFTVVPAGQTAQLLLGAYFDEAIRPNLAGRFAELLVAAVSHPSMLMFLDQNVSVGPNSRVGKRRGRGLNENLAREVLELHTLGVDGGYSQDDVRQFAELLTGLTVTESGTIFEASIAEPGAETILGKSYGSGPADSQHIVDFLEDLAVNPTTARHLATKLAVHFIGPDPDANLIDQMTESYLASGGELMAFYDVLVNHAAAKTPLGAKVRQPFEYMVCCLRAVQLEAEPILGLDARALTQSFDAPLTAMGQRPFYPSGPDGWDEALEAWITPPTLAARINWAGELAQNNAADTDPRQLLETVLGPLVPNDLDFAVAGSETKWEGITLMLVSPTFMRR